MGAPAPLHDARPVQDRSGVRAHTPPGADADAERPARLVPAALLGLAASLACIALLGPLLLDVIHYRYSATMLNQAVGLDAFALVVVAPLAVAAAVLWRRRHLAAPLLALAPAGFASYMLAQYVVGPEYLVVDGNAERAFPLFVGAFVLSGLVLLQAWAAARAPRWEDRLWRRRAALLFTLAVFVVVGVYLSNGFLAALTDFPQYVAERAPRSEYDEHPTAFWLVSFLDLGVVVPLTVATGVGLLHRRAWAAAAFYGVVGWYALVPGSVAAMALTMLARDDAAADAGRAVVLTTAAGLFLVVAARVFLPLLRQPAGATRRGARRA